MNKDSVLDKLEASGAISENFFLYFLMSDDYFVAADELMRSQELAKESFFACLPKSVSGEFEKVSLSEEARTSSLRLRLDRVAAFLHVHSLELLLKGIIIKVEGGLSASHLSHNISRLFYDVAEILNLNFDQKVTEEVLSKADLIASWGKYPHPKGRKQEKLAEQLGWVRDDQ